MSLPYLAGILLILLFAYALSWGFAVIGLSAPNSEVAQVISFPILFPLTFASSAFVPVSSMPSWLQGFATYQPVSVTVSACRALMIGGPTATWVIQSLLWSVGLLDRAHPPGRPSLPHPDLTGRLVAGDLRPAGTAGSAVDGRSAGQSSQTAIGAEWTMAPRPHPPARLLRRPRPP